MAGHFYFIKKINNLQKKGMRKMKRVNRLIAAMVLVSFIFTGTAADYAFALGLGTVSPGPRGSLRPGGEEIEKEMYATGQKEFAAKRGPTALGPVFEQKRSMPTEFIGEGPLPAGVTIIRDHSQMPSGWERNPILQETDIVAAMARFLKDEAGLPADRYEVMPGYWPPEAGKPAISRWEYDPRNGMWMLVIHTDFIKMWNELRDNDIWFEIDLPNSDNPNYFRRRTVSVAWAVFYRIAKHEMGDLAKVNGIPKSAGHFTVYRDANGKEIIKKIGSDRENEANFIGGRYNKVNDALWMWFLGSCEFDESTQYNNNMLKDQLRWFFGLYEGPEAERLNHEAIEMQLPFEFPNLSDRLSRDAAIGLALAVNKEFYTRKLKKTLDFGGYEGWSNIVAVTDAIVSKQFNGRVDTLSVGRKSGDVFDYLEEYVEKAAGYYLLCGRVPINGADIRGITIGLQVPKAARPPLVISVELNEYLENYAIDILKAALTDKNSGIHKRIKAWPSPVRNAGSRLSMQMPSDEMSELAHDALARFFGITSKKNFCVAEFREKICNRTRSMELEKEWKEREPHIKQVLPATGMQASPAITDAEAERLLTELIDRETAADITRLKVSFMEGDTVYFMDAADRKLVTARMDASLDEGKIDLAVHLTQYRQNSKTRWVVQSTSEDAAAVAAAGETIGSLCPECVAVLDEEGDLPVVAESGKEGLPAAVSAALTGHTSVIVADGGIITIGESKFEAYFRNKVVRTAATLYQAEKTLGHVALLERNDVEMLRPVEKERKGLLKGTAAVKAPIPTITIDNPESYFDEVMELRQQLYAVGREIARRGLVDGPGGNISVCTKDRKLMIIKASGFAFETMGPEDYVVVDMESGMVVAGFGPAVKPSVETAFHLAIYRTRPDIFAVVHGHPLYSTAMASNERNFSVKGSPETALLPYIHAGRPDLAQGVAAAVAANDRILLGKHGAITVAATLGQALEMTIALEDQAKGIVLNERAFKAKLAAFRKLEADLNALEAPSGKKDVKGILTAKNKASFAREELWMDAEVVRPTSLDSFREGDIICNLLTKAIMPYDAAYKKDGAVELTRDCAIVRPLTITASARQLRDRLIETIRYSRNKEEREASLEQLMDMIVRGFLPKPIETKDIFMHCHSTYSHSPGNTSAYIVWRAKMLGLLATGIVDHDTVDGFDEFLECARIANLSNPTCGYEQRCIARGTPFEIIETNSPNNEGETYYAFHGVSRNRNLLQEERVVPAKRERFAKTAAFINSLGIISKPLDYESHIRPLTETNNPTEKHVAEAIARLIYESFSEDIKSGNLDNIVSRTNDLIAACCQRAGIENKPITEKDLPEVRDLTKFTFLIRNRVVTVAKKISGLEPTRDEVMRDTAVFKDAHENNELVYYLYLGGENVHGAESRKVLTRDEKFEFVRDMKGSLDKETISWWLGLEHATMLHLWFKYQKSVGVDGIAFMPNRNTKGEIEEVVAIAEECGFTYLMNGMDVNTPDMPFTYYDWSSNTRFVREAFRIALFEQKWRKARDGAALLNKPLTIGSGESALIVQNRRFAQPMERTSCPGGHLSQVILDSYARLAKLGEYGAIEIEAAAIGEDRARFNQLRVGPGYEKEIRQLVDHIRANSPLGKDQIVSLQPNHSGSISDARFSSIIRTYEAKSEDKDNTPGKLLMDADVEPIINGFVEAAVIAYNAGANMVDVKCCHGYLLGQFLRPANIGREGWSYGGSFENRMKIVNEIITRIRARVRDKRFKIMVRFSFFEGDDIRGGIGAKGPDSMEFHASEPMEMIKGFVSSGADIINLSAGIPKFNAAKWVRPVKKPLEQHSDMLHYHHIRFAKYVRDMLKASGHGEVAIIGSGFSALKEDAEERANLAIGRGCIDMAGFGRQTLAGNNRCLLCSGCSRLLATHRPVGCVIHQPLYRILDRAKEIAKKGALEGKLEEAVRRIETEVAAIPALDNNDEIERYIRTDINKQILAGYLEAFIEAAKGPAGENIEERLDSLLKAGDAVFGARAYNEDFRGINMMITSLRILLIRNESSISDDAGPLLKTAHMYQRWVTYPQFALASMVSGVDAEGYVVLDQSAYDAGMPPLETLPSPVAEQPLTKIMSEYAIRYDLERGPAGVEPSVLEIASFYPVFDPLKTIRAEIYLQQDTEKALADALRRDIAGLNDRIRERNGGAVEDAIKIIPYNETNLDAILKRKPDANVRRIFVNTPSTTPLFRAAALAGLLRGNRFFTADVPAGWNDVENTINQAWLVKVSLLSCILDDSNKLTVGNALKAELDGRITDNADDFVNNLAIEENDDTDPTAVSVRVNYFLGTVVKLSVIIARQLRLLKAFWTAA